MLEIIEKSKVIKTNKFFHNFMMKHERVLDTAMDKINRMVESERRQNFPNYYENRSNSEVKTYKQHMSEFLGKQNIYRNLNQRALKDLRILNDASIIENFTKDSSGG
jgi:uncharacterized protein YaaR (DUF327 family)